MIRMIAVAFGLTLASSAQAVPVAPIQHPDSIVTTVREACGAGRTRINAVCVARTTKRQVRRDVRRSTTGTGVRYYDVTLCGACLSDTLLALSGHCGRADECPLSG